MPVPVDAVVARDGIVAEVVLAAGPEEWRFGQADGPFASYERLVRPDGDGRWSSTLHLQVGLPLVGWAFGPPLRRLLARPGADPGFPWWVPPARLGRRAAKVLVACCALEVLIGYLADLPSYTMTYAGTDLGAGTAAQGLALGVTRLAAVAALPLLALSDRRPRRGVLVAVLVAASACCALCALAPSLVALTVAEVASGAAVGAGAVLVGIVVVEEVPAGARAWSAGVATMSFGLGSGIAVAAIPLAGDGRGGWRWIFAAGALVAPLAWLAARDLAAGPAPAPAAPGGQRLPPRRRPARVLLLLGASAFLLACFADPAGALQVQYLRRERHLSPLAISVLLQVTGTVGGLGTLVGGRLADTRGRRPVAAVGLVALTVCTLAAYATGGVALWVAESASSACSYGITPALGVYGAELFPAGQRGRAGGVLTVAAAGGGLVGLSLAGALGAAHGSVLGGLVALAVAPLAVAALVWRAYPETAGVELVDLTG